MRLGGFFRPENLQQLEACVDSLDTYGLSTIAGPRRLHEMSEDEAIEYGERARALDIVIAEQNHIGTNVMSRDLEARQRHIDLTRLLLERCEAMGCGGTIILVGSPVTPDQIVAIDRYYKRSPDEKVDPASLAACPDPYLFTDEAKAEFREVVLRIVDGLDLQHAKLLIEPWNHSFFYRPADIREFMDSLGDPRVEVHLDMMNMMHQDYVLFNTDHINETFDILEPYVGGIHFKDLAWDWRHMFLKLDEVLIGDGLMDYHTLVRRVSQLDGDPCCFCEHRREEGDFAINFARLHKIAADVGARFKRRGE